MIDREARDELGKLLRRFRDSEMSGTALLRSWPGSRDPAISGMAAHFSVALGLSHISHNKKRSDMRVTEMPDRPHVMRELSRATAFLQTDLEYQWAEWPSLDRPLIPFYVLALFVSLPVVLSGLVYAEESARLPMGFLAALVVALITAATVLGGPRLCSLFTGIDRKVWPFYRRRDYRRHIADD